MIYPCRCGHEKADHQKRVGRLGNDTPCGICACAGFRKAPIAERDRRSRATRVLHNIRQQWASMGCCRFCGAPVRKYKICLRHRLQFAAAQKRRRRMAEWLKGHHASTIPLKGPTR